MVLDVYKRPFDPLYPVICMDESPKQLIAETRVPIPVSPGQPAKYDYEYRRCGVCNIFLACEPLRGKRMSPDLSMKCFVRRKPRPYGIGSSLCILPSMAAG